MGNNKSKISEQKIIPNNEIYINQQNKIEHNKCKSEKDEEIIIELEISNNEKEEEINILCDKNQLIKDIKENEEYYRRNNINPPKEFNYFNNDNTQLYLNNKKIEFKDTIKFEKNNNKLILFSNNKLESLEKMFEDCDKITK